MDPNLIVSYNDEIKAFRNEQVLIPISYNCGLIKNSFSEDIEINITNLTTSLSNSNSGLTVNNLDNIIIFDLNGINDDLIDLSFDVSIKQGDILYNTIVNNVIKIEVMDYQKILKVKDVMNSSINYESVYIELDTEYNLDPTGNIDVNNYIYEISNNGFNNEGIIGNVNYKILNNVLLLSFTDNGQFTEEIEYRSRLMIDDEFIVSNIGKITISIKNFDERIILNTQYIHSYNYQIFHIYLDGVNSLYKDSDLIYRIIDNNGEEVVKLTDASYGEFEINNNILRGIPYKNELISSDKTYQSLVVRAKSTISNYSIDVSYHIFYASSDSYLHHTHNSETHPSVIQNEHTHTPYSNGNGVTPSEIYTVDSNTLTYFVTYYMLQSTDVIKRKITDRIDNTIGIQALVPSGGLNYQVSIKEPSRPKGVVEINGDVIEYRMRPGNTDIPQFNEKEIVEWLAISNGKVLYKEEINIYLQYQHIVGYLPYYSSEEVRYHIEEDHTLPFDISNLGLQGSLTYTLIDLVDITKGKVIDRTTEIEIQYPLIYINNSRLFSFVAENNHGQTTLNYKVNNESETKYGKIVFELIGHNHRDHHGGLIFGYQNHYSQHIHNSEQNHSNH